MVCGVALDLGVELLVASAAATFAIQQYADDEGYGTWRGQELFVHCSTGGTHQ